MATVKVTEANFSDLVKNSEKTVLLDFYADWCGPCKMIAPVIEAISNENPDITVGKINVDDEPGLAAGFKITAIPTLVIVKNGQIKAKQMGVVPKSEILALIEKS